MAGPRLRVVLCTRGGLPGARVIERLAASPRVEISGVVLSTRMLHTDQGFAGAALECLRASGLAYAAYLWSSTSLADALLGSASVAGRAAHLGAPTWRTRRINGPDSRAFIAGRTPDLLVSAFFNQRIDAAVAAIPGLGAVNIHPSALPRFRGVDPVFHARLQGAASLGVSVHRIVPELDAGPILRQEIAPAPAGESVLHATARLYARGAALLLEALGDIEALAPGEPQAGAASSDSWPTRAQVGALARTGTPLARLRDLGRE